MPEKQPTPPAQPRTGPSSSVQALGPQRLPPLPGATRYTPEILIPVAPSYMPGPKSPRPLNRKAGLKILFRRKDEWTIEVGWQVENGPVKGLKIRCTMAATFTKANKIIIYEVSDENANKKEIEWVTIPFIKNMACDLLADNANPTSPSAPKDEAGKEFEVSPAGQLHATGGLIKSYLRDNAVVDKTKDELTKMQKVTLGLELKAKIKAAKNTQMLVNWLIEQLPDLYVTGRSRMPIEKLRPDKEIVDITLDKTLDRLGPDLGNVFSGMLPFVGQIMAGGVGLWKIKKAWTANKNAKSLFRHEKLIIKYSLKSERPQTPERLFHRLGDHLKEQTQMNLTNAAKKFTEFGLRFIPGSSTAVGIGANAAEVLLILLRTYKECRLVELTNWMLEQCNSSQDPDDYYHTITTGHVALTCYIINMYSDEQLNRRKDDLDEKVMKEIASSISDLRTQEKEINENIRYKMKVPPDPKK